MGKWVGLTRSIGISACYLSVSVRRVGLSPKLLYNTVGAYDGLEAFKAFENDKEGIDLVITDLVLPSISGVTLIGIKLTMFHTEYLKKVIEE